MPDPTRTADPAATLTRAPLGTSTVDQGEAATQAPDGSAAPAATPPAARYVLGAELARGGMGVVYRATDAVFGREVAVKVLQSRFDPQSGAARRFADEARITGQLQHPAIPPVHDLGTLPDGRPFLAMKLIRGETLDHELKARADPGQDHGRFVAAFEQVCQAIAYAHANRVLHRDLKPANVMVGGFGEVQVMDWGLAKVLSPTPTDDSEPPAGEPEVRSERAASGDRTEAGSVLGTPGFMPPEQAVGDVRRIGPRSDVFGLGGVLAVILTGKPPFVGGSSDLTRRMAAAGQVADCFARLDGCGADPELVALCKRCLNPDPAGRPADAGAVARAVADLRQAADERARRAEEDRAKAAVRASEQRKRRRVQVALAAAVGLLAVGGGAVAWWADRQERDRQAEALQRQVTDGQRAAAESARLGRNAEAVGGLLDQTKAALRAGDTAKAGTLLDEAAKRAAEGGADDYLGRIDECRAEVKLLRDLKAAERFRQNVSHRRVLYTDEHLRAWTAAIRAFGLEPESSDPAAVAKRITASAARDRLVSAFDYQLFEAKRPWPRDVLRAADPDPYRDACRDAMYAKDYTRLSALSADPRAFDQPVGFLVMLSGLGGSVTKDPSGTVVRSESAPTPRKRELLAHALTKHPNDAGLLMMLGQLAPAGERAGWYQAAVAADPTNSAGWNNLAYTLLESRAYPRAEAAAREAVRLAPDAPEAWVTLGAILARRGDLTGSDTALGHALRLNPEDVIAHCTRAALLQLQGDLVGAAAACRKAIELYGPCCEAHANLGFVLLDMNDRKGAEAAHRKAIELWPEFAPAHRGLGNVLLDNGDGKGAEAEYREALRLDPRDPDTHFNLGVVLREKGDLPGAEAAHREALRIDPNFAPAHNGLGNTLRDKGDLPAAIASFKEAIRLRPKFAFAHNNLGIALAMKGDLDESAAAFREALRVDPKNPGTAVNLDKVLAMKAARDAKAKARELAPPPRRRD